MKTVFKKEADPNVIADMIVKLMRMEYINGRREEAGLEEKHKKEEFKKMWEKFYSYTEIIP